MLERREAGGSLGSNKETLARAHFARDADHFFVLNGNRAAVRLAKNFQNKTIADRFWNAQARGNRMRIRKFCGGFFSRFECADDRRAARGLHGEHARTFSSNPAECFHFIECFSHSNEPVAAAGWIKNHIGQLPITLFRYYVAMSIFTFYELWFISLDILDL